MLRGQSEEVQGRRREGINSEFVYYTISQLFVWIPGGNK